MKEGRTDTLQALVARRARRAPMRPTPCWSSPPRSPCTRRLGKIEQIERAEGFDLGLRVFVGQARQAIVSSTDPDPAGFAALAERAVAMARAVPEDPYRRPRRPRRTGCVAGRPRPRRRDEPDAEALIGARRRGRGSGARGRRHDQLRGRRSRLRPPPHRAAPPATASPASTRAPATRCPSPPSPAAARRWSATTTTPTPSTSPIWRIRPCSAAAPAERAVARLNPRRPKTARLPVVYDPRVAGRPCSATWPARSTARRSRAARPSSRTGSASACCPPGVTVVDDPTAPRGLRSRPFDGEGMTGVRRAHRRGRRPDHLDAGLALAPASSTWRPPATPAAAPAARPRPRPPTSGSSPGTVTAGRADGRHPRRALRHGADRHGRERRHRRLQPRRGRLHASATARWPSR